MGGSGCAAATLLGDIGAAVIDPGVALGDIGAGLGETATAPGNACVVTAAIGSPGSRGDAATAGR